MTVGGVRAGDSIAISVVLYYTKGLADVALAEAGKLAGDAAVVEHTERFAILSISEASAESLRQHTRTIDDIRLLVGGPTDVNDLQDLSKLCKEAAVNTASVVAADGRADSGDWSITVSARNPAWRQGPEWNPAEVIAQQLHRADIGGAGRKPVDLRLQVDESCAHIAVNFATAPKRQDNIPVRPGALRPTVAAAMIRLAIDGLAPATKRLGIYDPFCGSGTIVAEAALAGFPVFGSDIDEQAVQITLQRLTREARAGGISVEIDSLVDRIFVHDIAKGFPPRVTARVLVGNMPWGKQIKIASHQDLFDMASVLVGHVVAGGGSAVLLTTNEDRFVARLRQLVKKASIRSRRIGLLGQTPAIVTARQFGVIQ